MLQSYSMQSRSNKFYFYDKDSQELAFKIEPEIVGSTVIYSYLQAIGVLNAHGKECGFCAQEPLMAAQEPDAFP